MRGLRKGNPRQKGTAQSEGAEHDRARGHLQGSRPMVSTHTKISVYLRPQEPQLTPKGLHRLALEEL
eukprot:5798654-Amphidinium_carterae.1